MDFRSGIGFSRKDQKKRTKFIGGLYPMYTK